MDKFKLSQTPYLISRSIDTFRSSVVTSIQALVLLSVLSACQKVEDKDYLGGNTNVDQSVSQDAGMDTDLDMDDIGAGGGAEAGDMDASSGMGGMDTNLDMGDIGVDGGEDAGVDVGADTGVDVVEDAGADGGVDGDIDAGVDVGADAGVDGVEDAGVEDAGVEDAGVEDAGVEDAGVDGVEDAGVDVGADAGEMIPTCGADQRLDDTGSCADVCLDEDACNYDQIGDCEMPAENADCEGDCSVGFEDYNGVCVTLCNTVLSDILEDNYPECVEININGSFQLDPRLFYQEAQVTGFYAVDDWNGWMIENNGDYIFLMLKANSNNRNHRFYGLSYDYQTNEVNLFHTNRSVVMQNFFVNLSFVGFAGPVIESYTADFGIHTAGLSTDDCRVSQDTFQKWQGLLSAMFPPAE